jgi:hypothetical protein
MMVDYSQVKEDLNRYAAEVAELKWELSQVKGQENAKFYQVLRRISNTETGIYKETMDKSKRINIVRNSMNDILKNYKKYCTISRY